jgi:nitrite reductase (cytochrome c-552)
MPYQRVGAMKVSSHHVRSPLLSIQQSCQTCHHWSEDELLARAQLIQDRTFELRNTAMDALIELITAIAADTTAAGVAEARQHQRSAQFLLDFIEAENSMGFHAPQEAARILARSIDASRRGMIAVLGR